MNPVSMNESKDPESTRDISRVSGMVSDVTRMMRASGVVMEALRVTIVCAQTDEMQPWGVRGVGGCSIFFCLLHEGVLQLHDCGAGSGCDSRRFRAFFGNMPSFSTEQA